MTAATAATTADRARPERRTRRRLFVGLVLAAVVGLLVGIVASEPGRVSVDVWLVVATLWVGRLLVGEALASAPVRSAQAGRSRWLGPRWLLDLVGRRRQPDLDTRPRPLVSLEGLLIDASTSERAAEVRLRPRLTALTSALLRHRHGVELGTPRADAVLGDVGWLVDPDHPIERPPSVEEIERLVERVHADGDETVRERSDDE